MSKIIAVVGATGAQGSSVIEHMLGQQSFALRGLTRDPSKANAKALADQGVGVVKADISSASDLDQAFKGAHAVFAVTDFWSHMSQEREIADGKRMVDAAKKAGVEHFVLSSLQNVTKLSGGKYTHVQHFDGKAQISDYLAASGLNWSVVQPGAYYQNFTGNAFTPRKSEDGSHYNIFWPAPADSPYHGFDASEDMGKFVRAVLLAGPKAYGKTIYACSEKLPVGEMVSVIGKHLGKDIRLQSIPADHFKAALPEAVANEMTEMLLWFAEFGYFGKDVDDKGLLDESNKFLAEHYGGSVATEKWAEFVQKAKWNVQ